MVYAIHHKKQFIPVFEFVFSSLILMSKDQLSLAQSGSEGQGFEVTGTNLTRGQQFTPILLVTHTPGVNLFTLGEPASSGLSSLAEEGNTTLLSALLSVMPEVREITTSSGLPDPGNSVTVSIRGGGCFDRLSMAAVLIPTNDGFFSINDVKGPEGGIR